MRWLLMATLCVYLPRYSITCFGPPKGRLAYTTQSLLYSVFRTFLSTVMLLASSQFSRASINLCLNTLLIAFTGKRKLPLFFDDFQHPAASNPPPGTIMCTWGCRLRFWPQVCN